MADQSASQLNDLDARQHRSGKLTALERVELLCDENSFEEDMFAEPSLQNDKTVMTGSGTIHGRRIFIFAKNYTHDAGALSATHAEKIVRLQCRALAARRPLIGLFDSDGMKLEDGVAALAAYADIVRQHVQASGVIPQIALIMGPCIGADAFAANLSNFIFMVAATGRLYVTGPEITNRLTDETLTAEELGGAAFHSATTGLADAAYDDDITALSQLRKFMDYLPSSHQDSGPERTSYDKDDRSSASLETLVPEDVATPYDIKELILKTVDEGDFFELQTAFAQNIVIGFGRMRSRTTGFIANQALVLGGVLDVHAAHKAARFVHFCDSFHIPLVSFVDAPGFLPGLNQEEAGLAKAGAELLSAVARLRLPKIAVILGQAYGPAYVMMASKHHEGDLTLAWPSARIGLMNTEVAVLSAAQAKAQGLIDAVIEPRMTRVHLLAALAAISEKQQPNS